MNILFDINHPAHIHYFRNAIHILRRAGHKVVITSREKDVTIDLLNNYGFSHIILSKAQRGLTGLGKELFLRQWKLRGILKKEKIHVVVSATGACSVHICLLMGIPSLVFYDTEDAALQNALTIPFATKYITPDSYMADGGRRHVTYRGVQELAYLHPKYFTPDPNVRRQLNIGEAEKYVVIRFVAWQAAHDIGKKGLSLEDKRAIIHEAARHARVMIVSEARLEEEFQQYRYTGKPEQLHDLLAFAALYIGESATMASESTCLGVPAIYVSPRKMGYVKEGERFGLIFDLEDRAQVIEKAVSILTRSTAEEWKKRRERFIQEHIDVTEFFVKTILEAGASKSHV